MKCFVLGVVAGFAASCAVAVASSTADHNGMFWNKLNRAAKDGYVNGYADATRITVSKLETLITAGGLFDWNGSRKIIHELERQISISELSPEDVISRLDRLYENKNYRELDLATALQLMALRPSMNNPGASTEK